MATGGFLEDPEGFCHCPWGSDRGMEPLKLCMDVMLLQIILFNGFNKCLLLLLVFQLLLFFNHPESGM